MRSALLAVALLGAFACGVNSATHHWQDAAVEAAWTALALFLRRYWPEVRSALGLREKKP